MVATILRPKSVAASRGVGKSTHYADVTKGLYTPPIKIGPRASGWPDTEVAALQAARIAGKSDDEIRALVKRLVAQRQAA